MKLDFGDIPEPGDRYQLGEVLYTGVFGKVYLAIDQQASRKKVTVKIQKYDGDGKEFIEEEYRILRDLSSHLNIVDFYGIYKKKNNVWFILEPCDGTAIDFVLGLLAKNRRISEDHIAYILKDTVRALIHLHENNVMHRDVRGSNILLTKEGEVKLCDFGLSTMTRNEGEKLTTVLGSPCWMAPELVAANGDKKNACYDNRIDLWALGITAIELGDGQAPFQEMHPSRAMFQIIRNPPPMLQKISYWSETFHDFISECLTKDYEYRPYMAEIIEHPFLAEVPENSYHLSLELKSQMKDLKIDPRRRPPEVAVIDNMLKRGIKDELEPMYDEDLAALRTITESEVVEVLEKRMELGEHYSFIGDILLALNPNCRRTFYGEEYHHKYQAKSRSDNAPHIYAVADTAYQNAMHHNTPQLILLTGETGSGKTTNYLDLIDHLFYVGDNQSVGSQRIKNAIHLVHSLIHASTPSNFYSTRAFLKTDVSYGKTGKLTGATFKVHCLEKWRVSTTDIAQSNFHFLYYIYDGLVSKNKHETYRLSSKRKYRYLRTNNNNEKTTVQPRDDIESNVTKYRQLLEYFDELEFSEEQTSTIHAVLAGILHLGETRFQENDEYMAVLEDREPVNKFSKILDIDETKMRWALTNYCVVRKGSVIKKRNTCDEAREARDVLANTLYARLVDYIISIINNKLEIGKSIFGAKYSVKVLDYFGFECFKENGISQLMVNSFNELLHYHFLQRIFAWEMADLKAEDIEFTPIKYYNNKSTLNELLEKPEGVLSIIDDASKKGLSSTYILENIYNQEKQKVSTYDASSFTVAHYTGKVTYNCSEMSSKNRDFLPPEIIETMRCSENPIVSMLFTNKLDKTGNLILSFEEFNKSRYNFTSKSSSNRQYSQIKKMRTQATIFKTLCLELLKELSVGGGSGSTHFVKCIRTDLHRTPGKFRKELVRQQVRAMAITDAARIRKEGYSQRIGFQEFLRRYKFLAFDFDENVEISGDNCRLLLIRLKMEGWVLGKSKIFLKYYNEEYLSRLYETQVKKIVKIQSILRGFLVKCKMAKQVKEQEHECIDTIQERRRRKSSILTEDEAAGIIQKAYRKKSAKRTSGTFEQLQEADCVFIRPFAYKWQKNSIFSVLMRYRAVKLQHFFNLSQQVHIYNQTIFHNLQKVQEGIDLQDIDSKATVSVWLGEIKAPVLKLHFRLDEIPFYDTSYMCDSGTNLGSFAEREESWDTPYRWRETQLQIKEVDVKENKEKGLLSNTQYCRDPEEPLPSLPEIEDETEGSDDIEDEKHDTEKLEKDCFNKNIRNNKDIQPIQPKPRTKIKKQEAPANNLTSVNLRKTDYTYKAKVESENFINNSSPANKDFEFIKATPVTVRPRYSVDPIEELRNMARRDSDAKEDDPPFNFQGMLRKTNFKRDSMKKALDGRRDSLKNALDAVRRFSLPRDDENEKTDIQKNDTGKNRKQISFEVMPGLIMEGVEVEL
nr:unnamed protein product [Callosobruchus chinensis]